MILVNPVAIYLAPSSLCHILADSDSYQRSIFEMSFAKRKIYQLLGELGIEFALIVLPF